MKNECGICEYKGDFANAAQTLCETCADAIRRLHWIRERERQAAMPPLAFAESRTQTGRIAAALVER